MSRSNEPPTSLVVVAAVAALVAIGPFARADEARPTARLELERAPDAAGCPDAAAFSARVATRLGHDPFEPDGAVHVRVRFALQGRRVVGVVAILDRDGRAIGTRRLEEARDRCATLADAVAAAVAIAIDPVGRSQSPADDVPSTAPALPSASAGPLPAGPEPERAPAPAPAPAPTAERRPPVAPIARLDGLVSFGVAPGSALGAQLGVGARRASLSIAAEARVEITPAAVRLSPRDRVTASMLSGSLVPCGHVDPLELCVGFRAGSLQAKALDVTRPSLESTFVAAAVGRFTVVIRVHERLTARVGVEGGLPLVRTTFSVDGQSIWTAPAVHGTGFVGIGWTAL